MVERTVDPLPAAMVHLVDDESVKGPVDGMPRTMRVALLALLGAAVGVAPAAHGLYDVGTWAPVGVLVFAVLLVAIATLRERVPRRLAAAAVALAALGAVQLASQLWAESTAQAALEGHRTLVYAAFLGLLIMLLSTVGARTLLLASVAAASAALAVAITAALLTSAGPEMFSRARLFDPVGYSNGQAAALLLAFWPLVACAEHTRRLAYAAPAVALASLLAGLSILTQSRSAVLALVVSAVLTLAVVPGRAKRLGILVLVCAALATAWTALDGVAAAASPATGQPPLDVLREAVLTILVSSAGAGAVYALVTSLLTRAHTGLDASALRRLRTATLGTVACAVVILAVLLGPAASRSLDERWHSFTHLDAIENTGSRFSAGGGNRYDYWRVALAEWRQRPVAGVGAGNYDAQYFQRRRTTEDVRQPHSLFFQTLAETGLAGLLVLLAFIGLLVVALREGVRRARDDHGARALTVGAGGIVTLWLVQASVDWLYLLPGLTLAMLCGAAVLLSFLRDGEPPRPLRRPGARPLVFAATLVAAASTGVMVASEHERDEAARLLATDPRAALTRAQDAVRLDGADLRGYYLVAAAQARLDRYPAARASLNAAVRLEPHDFVARALLGDLATRRGDGALARASYAEASRLNPRDPALRRLAAEARLADEKAAP